AYWRSCLHARKKITKCACLSTNSLTDTSQIAKSDDDECESVNESETLEGPFEDPDISRLGRLNLGIPSPLVYLCLQRRHGICHRLDKDEHKICLEFKKYAEGTMIIEAIKKGNSGTYIAEVACDRFDGPSILCKFVLTDYTTCGVLLAKARLVDTESEPKEAPFEAEELQALGFRVLLMGEEFEAVKPSGTRTDLSYSSASSYSTAPLSPDHPLNHVSPTPTPTHASFHHRTVRMAVRAQPVTSPSLSASVIETMALSDSAFHKRERSDDEGHGSDDKGRGLEGEGLGLEEEEEAAPEGQQQAVSIVDTAASEPLSLGYRAASHPSVRERQEAKRVSAFRQPTLVTWVDPEDDKVYTNVPARLDALPPTLVADIDRDVRELYTRSGVVRDKIFSQRYMFISLEREQERTIMAFGALWRPVLALEAWAGHVDTRLTDMSRDRYDDHRLIHDMLVQQAAM
ncbi:hypothetical protein Tco_0305069, partial [Tanacetum coccineum]